METVRTVEPETSSEITFAGVMPSWSHYDNTVESKYGSHYISFTRLTPPIRTSQGDKVTSVNNLEKLAGGIFSAALKT